MLVLGRIVIDLIGYVAACLAASLTINLLLLPQIGLFAGQGEEFASAVMLVTVPLAAAVISAFAFVPALLAAFIAEAWSLTGWLYHAIAGGLIGLACAAGYQSAAIEDFLDAGADLAIFPPGASLESSGFLGIAIAGGIVAGFAYWLIAGRSSGSWRSGGGPTSPAP